MRIGVLGILDHGINIAIFHDRTTVENIDIVAKLVGRDERMYRSAATGEQLL